MFLTQVDYKVGFRWSGWGLPVCGGYLAVGDSSVDCRVVNQLAVDRSPEAVLR